MDIRKPASPRVPLGVTDLVAIRGLLATDVALHEQFLLYVCIDTD